MLSLMVVTFYRSQLLKNVAQYTTFLNIRKLGVKTNSNGITITLTSSLEHKIV